MSLHPCSGQNFFFKNLSVCLCIYYVPVDRITVHTQRSEDRFRELLFY